MHKGAIGVLSDGLDEAHFNAGVFKKTGQTMRFSMPAFSGRQVRRGALLCRRFQEYRLDEAHFYAGVFKKTGQTMRTSMPAFLSLFFMPDGRPLSVMIQSICESSAMCT